MLVHPPVHTRCILEARALLDNLDAEHSSTCAQLCVAPREGHSPVESETDHWQILALVIFIRVLVGVVIFLLRLQLAILVLEVERRIVTC